MLDGVATLMFSPVFLMRKFFQDDFFVVVKSTIVFKENVGDLEMQCGNERFRKEGFKFGVNANADAFTGPGIGAKAIYNAEKGMKDTELNHYKYKRGDRGRTSELSIVARKIRAVVGQEGKIENTVEWTANDLNLSFEQRYDGDCKFQMRIKID